VLLKRRHFLLAGAALGGASLLRAAPPARRVVIVGGGWGGLGAARHLRAQAPELDVVLIERNAQFRSLPLSNKWLVGQVDGTTLTHDYQTAASAWGYRYVQAEANAIDRDKRRVHTSAGGFDYDWLVLALGIRHDYAAWFGDDRASADHARTHFPSAYTAGPELDALRDKLAAFKGGTLLMTVPPLPYRCPPAPYERAVLLAGWLDARRIPGKLLVLDPNTPTQGFQQIFDERHPERIDYRSQTRIVALDPRRRTVRTEFDDFAFDDAILMPPQQAGDLAWQAGLIGKDSGGWAPADPLSFASRADERIFVVGDMLDRVSPLFGHYPKSGQMASRQGRIVARHIAALARDATPPREFPDSVCHIATRFDPPEALRIEANFRLRGDGALMQQARTTRDAQPRGEDLAWAAGMLREFFAPPGGTH
jgi:NADPH-dependent 2,4-dienoyl-CoA reductase/sulfur reductase-like enzyme